MRTLRQGADEIKEYIDRDNQGTFPFINFGILLFIALVLYLVWDKLGERMEPSSQKRETAGGWKKTHTF